MIKISLIVVLALAGQMIKAQDGNEPNAAPEPYSYGYETDTHSAAEQKDPSGAVTGFYTINDADGRQRRVEYVADASGFRAKVQTNELGTKSANSADVEVLAQPPNPEQLVYQAPAQQQQVVQVQRQQTVALKQQPAVVTQQSFVQQPQQFSSGYYGATQYGYYPGAIYGGYGGYGAYGLGGYNMQRFANYPYNYNYNLVQPYSQAGLRQSGSYYSYNNHLPSQYYAANGLQQAVGGGIRYVANGANVQPANGVVYQTLGRSGYQTNQIVPGTTSYTTSTTGAQETRRSGDLVGSSNYVLLKKRESANKNEKESS